MLPALVGIASVSLLVLAADLALSQNFPNRPIRLVTGAAGGGGDFDSRLIAPVLSASLGQPVIVENRPQVPQAEVVMKAPPDGHTLAVSGSSFWTYPLLRPAPYDVVRDFTPISIIERTVNVLAVHPSLPVKSVKELIALAKTRPGELVYSSGSLGGSQHLGMELLKSMTGINMVHVPYKGGALSVTAVIGGETHLTIAAAVSVVPHMKSGRLRALAVTSVEPSAIAPGLPPVAATVPGFEAVTMTGVFAPAKTPAAIVNRLNQELVRIMNTADVKEKLFNVGVEVIGSSPEQLAAMVNGEIARWGKVIKDAGIKVD